VGGGGKLGESERGRASRRRFVLAGSEEEPGQARGWSGAEAGGQRRAGRPPTSAAVGPARRAARPHLPSPRPRREPPARPPAIEADLPPPRPARGRRAPGRWRRGSARTLDGAAR
jgi:hypothetical protein